MKRQIEFRHENDRYALFENNVLLFSIDGTSLQFDSLQFYDGVYKDKSSAIDLINKLTIDDSLGKDTVYVRYNQKDSK